MTLATRNLVLLAGTGISCAVLAVLLVFTRRIIPALPDIVEEASRRPEGFFAAVKLPVFYYAPFVVMLTSAVYACAVQIFVFRFFEKTFAPEVNFFALFAFSFTFECGRMFVPFLRLYQMPLVFPLAAYRLELLGRLFGLLALFASSVYAASPKLQKQGTVLFAIFVTALLISLRIPIDPLSWDTNLQLKSDYSLMLRNLEISIALLSAGSFFVSAYLRGSREFILAGAGVFLLFLGRMYILSADTLIVPFAAAILLAGGTYLACSQLRRVYLWL